MKVAIVMFGGQFGGAERRILPLAWNLSQINDMEIAFITNDKLYDSIPSDISGKYLSGIEHYVLRSLFIAPVEYHDSRKLLKEAMKLFHKTCSLLSYLLLSVQLLRRIKRDDAIDLIQLVLGGAMITFVPLFHLVRKPTVASVIGEEIRGLSGRFANSSVYERSNLFRRVMIRRALRLVDQVDVLSEELMECIQEHQLIDKRKLNLVPSFVETDEYIPSVEKKDWVVFSGRLVSIKNPLLFVESIPMILENCAVERFFLLGKGPLENQVQQRLSELGIEQAVVTGFCSDVQTILSHSLVFVSLQSYENYPSRALLEAMSCGNAIVATDVGYTHLLVNEQTGIRVPADSKAIAKTITSLLNNRSTTIAMGRRARELVVNRHGLDRYLKDIRQVYRRTLDGFCQG